MTPLRKEKGDSHLMTPPLTRQPFPPHRRRGAGDDPWLYTAVIGNGNVLGCLDATGSLIQMFYPHIDAGPHIRTLLMGLQLEGEEHVWWLNDRDWTHTLGYRDQSATVYVISTHSSGVRLERIIAADPTHDVISTELSVTGGDNRPLRCALVVLAGFDIDQRRGGTTCYYQSTDEALIFYGADRYFAICGDAPVTAFAAAPITTDDDPLFAEVSAGHYNANDSVIGDVSGALRLQLDAQPRHHLYLCCARALDDMTALLAIVRAHPPQSAGAITWWQERYQDRWLKGGSERVRRIYDRSLITLHLLTDRATGGIIAAPEMDAVFRSSGGYGYCWPRDGAFIAHALDIAGEHDQARSFFDWAWRTQERDGGWYHRYSVNGNLAPSWGLVQFDETGLLIWAAFRHIGMTSDLAYARTILPHLIRAANYMRAALDPALGIAPFTIDLWEEVASNNTYASACTWSAFLSLAHLADTLGDTDLATQWYTEARHLKIAIESHLWSEQHRRFLRGRNQLLFSEEVTRLRLDPHAHLRETTILGQQRYLREADPTVDISLLGLSVPCGVFSADDPRIIATAQAIREHLTGPNGGILRYQNDRYRGGNPWVLCTLWLAWQEFEQGDMDMAIQHYRWVLDHATVLDLLPEQVDRQTGEPCWIVPLAWSHAMFVLVTKSFASLGLLP
jgi:glucoamylase